MKPIRLLIIAGSERAGAYSRHLARVAAAAARRDGCDVTEFDLRALALPIYDGDLEHATACRPRRCSCATRVHAHDALLLVTPEYNGVPDAAGAQRVRLDVAHSGDRRRRGRPRRTTNRPAALLSSSPGPLGGLRAMNLMRQYLRRQLRDDRGAAAVRAGTGRRGVRRGRGA